MIALTACGIRKAYKKQQARKARKEQLERKNQSLISLDPSHEFRSTSSSLDTLSSDPLRPISGEIVNYDQRSPSRLTRAPSTSPSGYSASLYSQVSYTDPLEEMRQYQAYIQRQSYGISHDTNPPSYDFVVEQGIEPAHPWKSGLNFPGRTESLSEIREARHIPQVPNRVIELDSSSESSPPATGHVPLRVSHPRSPIAYDKGPRHPTTELFTDLPEHGVSPTLDDELQASLDELAAEITPPLRIRNSKEAERYELPANEITPTPAGDDPEHDPEHEAEHKTAHERLQLKRPRAESGSEIESEDNEDVIIRFNVADRTNRPFPKRLTMADYEE